MQSQGFIVVLFGPFYSSRHQMRTVLTKSLEDVRASFTSQSVKAQLTVYAGLYR